jgi:hypothetical protein
MSVAPGSSSACSGLAKVTALRFNGIATTMVPPDGVTTAMASIVFPNPALLQNLPLSRAADSNCTAWILATISWLAYQRLTINRFLCGGVKAFVADQDISLYATKLHAHAQRRRAS